MIIYCRSTHVAKVNENTLYVISYRNQSMQSKTYLEKIMAEILEGGAMAAARVDGSV